MKAQTSRSVHRSPEVRKRGSMRLELAVIEYYRKNIKCTRNEASSKVPDANIEIVENINCLSYFLAETCQSTSVSLE